jgi:hypothetical protein
VIRPVGVVSEFGTVFEPVMSDFGMMKALCASNTILPSIDVIVAGFQNMDEIDELDVPLPAKEVPW